MGSCQRNLRLLPPSLRRNPPSVLPANRVSFSRSLKTAAWRELTRSERHGTQLPLFTETKLTDIIGLRLSGIFPEGKEPSIRTLRSWTKVRRIPYHRVGHFIFHLLRSCGGREPHSDTAEDPRSQFIRFSVALRTDFKRICVSLFGKLCGLDTPEANSSPFQNGHGTPGKSGIERPSHAAGVSIRRPCRFIRCCRSGARPPCLDIHGAALGRPSRPIRRLALSGRTMDGATPWRSCPQAQRRTGQRARGKSVPRRIAAATR